jgi:hypothetical protein
MTEGRTPQPPSPEAAPPLSPAAYPRGFYFGTGRINSSGKIAIPACDPTCLVFAHEICRRASSGSKFDTSADQRGQKGK